jgi:hypothetical protein
MKRAHLDILQPFVREIVLEFIMYQGAPIPIQAGEYQESNVDPNSLKWTWGVRQTEFRQV